MDLDFDFVKLRIYPFRWPLFLTTKARNMISQEINWGITHTNLCVFIRTHSISRVFWKGIRFLHLTTTYRRELLETLTRTVWYTFASIRIFGHKSKYAHSFQKWKHNNLDSLVNVKSAKRGCDFKRSTMLLHSLKVNKKKTSSAGNKVRLTPLIPVYLLETLNSLLNKNILAFQAWCLDLGRV